MLERKSPASELRRCTVRPARPGDATSLAAWRLEPSIRAHQPLPIIGEERLRFDLQRQLGYDITRGRGEKFQWIVEVDGRPAGWITLAIINWEHGLAEVGYALTPEFQGRGLMSHALGQLLDMLFRRTELERIEARCASRNTASRRVLEQTGFRREGTLRKYFSLDGERLDNELYAILREDWEVGARGEERGARGEERGASEKT
jgi:RimJ/RimL family protein N-acetyltransferase